jgi:hypothetical protein
MEDIFVEKPSMLRRMKNISQKLQWWVVISGTGTSMYLKIWTSLLQTTIRTFLSGSDSQDSDPTHKAGLARALSFTRIWTGIRCFFTPQIQDDFFRISDLRCYIHTTSQNSISICEISLRMKKKIRKIKFYMKINYRDNFDQMLHENIGFFLCRIWDEKFRDPDKE